jgi:hypothetical protein
MPIHKLANGPITLNPVTAVESAEGNFGPQMVFKGNADDLVFISEMSGAKGLARLNLTPETVIGKAITLEQIKKDGKTFTNLHLAGGASAPVAAPVATVTVPARPEQLLAVAASVYSECVAQAMVTLGARCEEAGIPIDAAAIQSAAATLFIRVMR